MASLIETVDVEKYLSISPSRLSCELITKWGRWDLNPRAPAPRAGILNQARQRPLAYLGYGNLLYTVKNLESDTLDKGFLAITRYSRESYSVGILSRMIPKYLAKNDPIKDKHQLNLNRMDLIRHPEED